MIVNASLLKHKNYKINILKAKNHEQNNDR